MQIEVDDRTHRMLAELAANHFAVRGSRAMPLEEVVAKLVRDCYSHYNPPEYQTTGFDRR